MARFNIGQYELNRPVGNRTRRKLRISLASVKGSRSAEKAPAPTSGSHSCTAISSLRPPPPRPADRTYVQAFRLWRPLSAANRESLPKRTMIRDQSGDIARHHAHLWLRSAAASSSSFPRWKFCGSESWLSCENEEATCIFAYGAQVNMGVGWSTAHLTGTKPRQLVPEAVRSRDH